MTFALRRAPWLLIILPILALGTLYAGAITAPFTSDDYALLETARPPSPVESRNAVEGPGAHARPLAWLYFGGLDRIAGDHPLGFHVAGFVLFLAALALLADLLRALLPRPGVMAGCVGFALLPLQRVNLQWIACGQDLLALVAALGAIALHRRGRTIAAALAYAAAVASKETALPLPLALLAWDLVIDRRDASHAARRLVPFAAIAIVWASLALPLGGGATGAPALRFDLAHFAAGYAHLVQSLLGLEHPPGMLASLLGSPPALVPLALLAALAWWYAPGAASTGAAAAPVPPLRIVAFGAAWLAAFGLVTGPAAATWSSCTYTLAAVGGALGVGLVLSRGDRWTWIGLVAALLWWHAGSTNTRAFAVANDPWVWTSHVTPFRLERAATLADRLGRALRDLEPAPPRDTRFFFAALPSGAGFERGGGALVRAIYRDPSLAAHFYSEYSESTAADHPVRFLRWDGARLQPMHGSGRTPYFQIGTDLLLLDRPAGAEHAFRRGLREGGGDDRDLRYWLGWTELWLGKRDAAEALWSSFGARDDSLLWFLHMRSARHMLYDERDSLEARRHLIRAIENGIGRPEGHSMLGNLLLPVQPKYAMLELRVAIWLDPGDWMARRDRFLGLARSGLDDAARREMELLEPLYPAWQADSAIVSERRALETRVARGRNVAEFPATRE